MIRNNLGKICVSFPEDGKSVILKPSNDVYTLDKIYHPLTHQVFLFLIFSFIFKTKTVVNL